MLNSVWQFVHELEYSHGTKRSLLVTNTDQAGKNYDVVIPVFGFSIIADEDGSTLRLLKGIDAYINKVVMIVNGVEENILRVMKEAKAVLEEKVTAGLVTSYSVRHFPNQLGCAGAMNQIVFEVPDADYWLILNNDVYFKKGALKRAAAFIEEVMKNEDRTHLVHLAKNMPWTAFAWTRQGVADIGFFDENIFPAFYEDTDYASRGPKSVVSEEVFAVHSDHSGHSRFTTKGFHKALLKSGKASHNQLFWANKIGIPVESDDEDNGILVVPHIMGYTNFTAYHSMRFNRSDHIGSDHRVTLVDPLRRLCTYRGMCALNVRRGECAEVYMQGKYLWDASLTIRGVDESLKKRGEMIKSSVERELTRQRVSEGQCCRNFLFLHSVCPNSDQFT
jgi:hypothetical protein